MTTVAYTYYYVATQYTLVQVQHQKRETMKVAFTQNVQRSSDKDKIPFYRRLDCTQAVPRTTDNQGFFSRYPTCFGLLGQNSRKMVRYLGYFQQHIQHIFCHRPSLVLNFEALQIFQGNIYLLEIKGLWPFLLNCDQPKLGVMCPSVSWVVEF